MRTENKENYGQDDRNFQNTASSANEPLIDESTSYVDQYENIPLDDDNPEEETIVNEEDSITNDQDNLDQEFLDALQEDEDEQRGNDDLADNDLNDLEGDHLNNPELDREEHNIRSRDASKID